MFVKAEKKSAKLRLSLAGPSGSGKTFTSLVFATAFAPTGKIAVVDTEHGSASKYADTFSFDVVELSDFHPNNYVQAIKAACAADYEVIVLDSITHAWNGKGGILSIVDRNFGKWKDVAPIEQNFIEAIISSPIHIIATMRAKTQYEVEQVNGKATPRKVGMGAIQRDGMEYEFDIAAMLDIHNTITIEKTRCPAIHNVTANRPDASFVKPIIEWLSGTSSVNGNGHTRTTFAHVDEALNWAIKQGFYNDITEAKARYDFIKKKHNPKTAQEMWLLWIENAKPTPAGDLVPA